MCVIVHKFTLQINMNSNNTKRSEKHIAQTKCRVQRLIYRLISTADYGDDCSRVRGSSNVTTPH